jgi:serpin B
MRNTAFTTFATGVLMIATGFAGSAAGSQPATQPATRPADEAALAQNNTAFALDVYGRLRERQGNLFLSPFSISTALAMTYAGARGETAAEMAHALHFDLPTDRLPPAFAAILNELNPAQGAAERPYKLFIANALWAAQGHKFLPQFLQTAQTDYNASVSELDFRNAVEQARQTINDWVAQHTADKIKNLIPQGILDATTQLVLTNAIYFKGNWAAKFDPKSTKEEPFTRADGSQVNTPLMHQTGEFGYLDEPDFQGLELPYVGNRLRMLILLPRKTDGLPELEKKLTPQALAAWLGRMDERKVQVSMPKFKLTSEFRLDQALRELGMKIAFEPGRADFSGMDGTHELYIGAVLHKAYVDVNEEGTEAAGATGVVMKMRATPGPPPVFRADHPFLFVIRDAHSGSLLFMGRLVDPRAEPGRVEPE